MKATDRHEAAMIAQHAAARLYHLGITTEIDDYGQIVFYPPEGFDFDLDPRCGFVIIQKTEATK